MGNSTKSFEENGFADKEGAEYKLKSEQKKCNCLVGRKELNIETYTRKIKEKAQQEPDRDLISLRIATRSADNVVTDC
ncbi:hypothetical protein L2E82_30343 [Cichorium intybus]|uniref:Uncharacterized protein n=1 Tax=Cichorium intybus TaxID=13427 RepID=A0ACB9D026_CICIN|nr:hypothetical protein L2E82_30343 [Cichorium intybus]